MTFSGRKWCDLLELPFLASPPQTRWTGRGGCPEKRASAAELACCDEEESVGSDARPPQSHPRHEELRLSFAPLLSSAHSGHRRAQGQWLLLPFLGMITEKKEAVCQNRSHRLHFPFSSPTPPLSLPLSFSHTLSPSLPSSPLLRYLERI